MSCQFREIKLNKKIIDNTPSSKDIKKYCSKWSARQYDLLTSNSRFCSALLEDLIFADKIAKEILGIKES